MTMLYGFDISVILLALWKLIAEEVQPGPRLRKYVPAVLFALAVALAGLQSQGLLFPPEWESRTVLVLTTVTAFLGYAGYITEVQTFALAVSDTVKIRAVALFGATGETTVAAMMDRYDMISPGKHKRDVDRG